MPITKSAKKQLRQNRKRRLHNKGVKSGMRTQIKKVVAAVSGGNAARAGEELKAVYKQLDQAAAKKVIHPNAAARHKSRLAKKLNAVKSAETK